MPREMQYGEWAQIIGSYDLQARRGAILSMLPTKSAFSSLEGSEDRVRLKGFGSDGQELFNLAVNPMTNSCGIQGHERMFEEFVPVDEELRIVRLFIDGEEASHFAAGSARRPAIALGMPTAERPNRIPLTTDAVAEPNVSYILQVRPEGDSRWHTMAVGLTRPDTANVDLNQFPGASALDVRVLQNNGIEKLEVFRERREF